MHRELLTCTCHDSDFLLVRARTPILYLYVPGLRFYGLLSSLHCNAGPCGAPMWGFPHQKSTQENSSGFDVIGCHKSTEGLGGVVE